MKTNHFFTLRMHNILLIIAILLSTNTFINAEVRLPQVLSSDMVFQRNADIKIWGWADRGETVKVSFNNITRTTRTSKDGKWSVIFPPMKEGGPYDIIIRGKKNNIELKNILIGDVWICSGQSNMAWSVARSENAEEEIKLADYPKIRLLTIPRNTQLSVSEDVTETEWVICSPENIPNFSAVGYFFGRHVHKETGIPIGLINTSWGGTIVEAWISVDFMKGIDEYAEKLKLLDISTPESLQKAEALRVKMLEDNFKITAGVIPAGNWADPHINLSDWRDMNLPAYWEARGLSGIDGIVWFRKEINLAANEASGEFTLNLGKIDDSDITWVNGVEVGSAVDQKDRNRSYKIKNGILKPGNNIIVVKVKDQQGNGGFWGAPTDMNLTGNNINIPLAGTWKYRLSGENLKYTHSAFGPNDVPSQLFNGMIYPLLNLKVSGSIWYQGESNAGRAYRYRTLFPLMINSWRTYWKQADMPFIFVQLANFKAVKPDPGESDWAELREAQQMTLSLPNTGMAVIIDIGEANDIHPRNKQDVGYRLALNALKLAYGKNVVSMGPLYRSMEKSGDKITLSFDYTGTGLMSKDKYGYLKGFSIAGSNKEFHWAKAYLEGNKVVVYSDDVSSPVAVRYGWADNPDDANLYNKEGLPASPFRTDDWKGITEGK